MMERRMEDRRRARGCLRTVVMVSAAPSKVLLMSITLESLGFVFGFECLGLEPFGWLKVVAGRGNVIFAGLLFKVSRGRRFIKVMGGTVEAGFTLAIGRLVAKTTKVTAGPIVTAVVIPIAAGFWKYRGGSG